MATLGSPTYYRNGVSGATSVIGYESGLNRVVRFSFTTGETGATKIQIKTTAGTIQNVEGSDLTTIPFCITTSSTSHKNANKASNSVVTGYIKGSSGNEYSGSANVVLMASTKYYIWFFPDSKTFGWSYWHDGPVYYTDCTVSGTSKYYLSISAGDGSLITVNRTSSPAGLSTGNLSNKSVIYKNDTLKITFSPQDNYEVSTHKVNNKTFASGNTHTVSGNVSVESTATPLKSIISATNAEIESVSAISITKYNSNYTHDIKYEFKGETGVIEEKTHNTNVSWVIPDSFYTKIPDAKSGVCVLTCETFNGDKSLGSTSCSITIETNSSKCSPVVLATVKDVNANAIKLTGDDSKLIRYKSIAQCNVTATPQNSSSIKSIFINGKNITGTTSNGVTTGSMTYLDNGNTIFVVSANDSRSYNKTISVSPSMINYVKLTCNPVITRPYPTSNIVTMTFVGNFYNGNFGKCSNTLMFTYRYRESGGTYSEWCKLNQSDIIYNSSNTYSSSGQIPLGDNFDYKKTYEVQICVTDGGLVDDVWYELSRVEKTIPIKRGIPVFDWGENDFNVNVDFMLKNNNIFNIIYPVGSIYMHSSGSLPSIVSDIGTWESIETGINNAYAWKRMT